MFAREVQENKKIRMPQSGQNKGVTAYIPEDIKEELEEWADEEERSISWLVGKLIEDAVKRRREQRRKQESDRT